MHVVFRLLDRYIDKLQCHVFRRIDFWLGTEYNVAMNGLVIGEKALVLMSDRRLYPTISRSFE
ncbi:hypothetical protein KIN20_025365 [Parelaphostrongylus tenuis]|uniref:Uncharacterized protein n=1 Tax=Parelaphostrongylus tenuis TaxID=148309 RepID=A0AAD5MYC6_PARTN|nr:hypothetical protein KIN20_025365 [Parelaphostrongylus tenuis]